jgi:orotidine-5'-phosphate decarboxylase
LDEEAREEFAQVFRRGELGEVAEEIPGEVLGVTRGLRQRGGDQGRVTKAQAVVAVQGAKPTLATVRV